MKLVGIIGTGVAVIAALALTVLTLFGSIPNADWDLREHFLDCRTAAVRPSGATDSFAYDGLGNWTTYTNAEGHVYTMTYDALSRPLTATNALDQQVFRNFYDPVGNLTNRLDGAGNATRYAYDELNRLVRRESCVQGPASSFSYDAVGNLLTASNAVAQETFAYDVMDRVASATTTVNGYSFATQWKRDTGGLATNLVYAPGKTLSRRFLLSKLLYRLSRLCRAAGSCIPAFSYPVI